MLNSCYGGLNPRAVKTAIHYGLGAKYVQFGSHSTYFMASREARLVGGKLVPLKDLYPKFAQEELSRAIRVPLEDPISPELEEILQVIADNPHIYINTGHVSGQEALRLVDLAQQYGVNKIVIAGYAVAELSLEQQKEVARKGAFLEHSFAQYIGTEGVPKTHYYVEREYMFDAVIGVAKDRPNLRGLGDQIREIGPEHFILDTDYGVRSLPPPVEGMRQFIACLLDMEFRAEEIRMMTSINPSRLLSLD